MQAQKRGRMDQLWYLPPELELEGIDSWNIRQEPSPDSAIIGVIHSNEVFRVTDRRDDWLRVHVGNVNGWSYCKMPSFYGDLQALTPVRSETSVLPCKTARRLQRSSSREETFRELLKQLRNQHEKYEELKRTASPEMVRAAVELQRTLDNLEMLGISLDQLQAETGKVLEPDEESVRLVAELNRTLSYSHSDFVNPKAESCWLSTFFQSLWHSRVFHTAFENLVKPVLAKDGTALAALQKTWQMYEDASAHNTLVPVSELVAAWGAGYGDCSEAFGKFHEASDLQFLSDLFAFVPVPWTGKTTTTEQLQELVEQVESPLLVFDLTFPALERSSMQTLAWALRPEKNLGGARLVAMSCYMEDGERNCRS